MTFSLQFFYNSVWRKEPCFHKSEENENVQNEVGLVVIQQLEYEPRSASRVNYRSWVTRASILIALVDTLKDYGPKPTILCLYRPEVTNNIQFQEQCEGARSLSANEIQIQNQSHSRISNFRFTVSLNNTENKI